MGAARRAADRPPGPEESDGPNFPKIPNRWIVLRHHRQKISEKAHPVVRGWFIRSDIKAANDDTDYAAILPDKAVPNSSGGYPVNEFYGCVYPLNEEEIPSEEDDKAPEEQFLTAESAFLPAFTQYQPYNQNIFSFHDKWDSLIEAQKPYTTSNELTVSYLVAGWYSDTHSDLIQSTAGSSALSSLLQELGWKVEGRLPDAAEHSIYVGTVMAMPWRTNLDLSDDDYTYSSSGGKKFRLEGRPQFGGHPVVAHSSIEAQAALLGQNKVSAETVALWEAFQYQLLDDTRFPHTPPHNQRTAWQTTPWIRSARFLFLLGARGIVWQLSPTGTASQPVALYLRAAQSLQQAAAAQHAQAAYDRDVLQLRDLTTRLKGLWWITSPKGNEPTPAVKAEMDKLAAAITTCLKDMSERRTKLLSGKTTDELVKSIEEWCKEHGIPADCELRPVPRPAFRKANNPVVLLQGLQDPERKDELDGYLGGLVPVRSADPSLMSGKGPSSNLVYDTDDETETAKDNYSSTDVIPARIAKHLAALYDEFTTLESVAFQNPLKKGTSYRPLTEVLKEKTPNSYVPPYTRWWRQPWRPTFISGQPSCTPTARKHAGRALHIRQER
ncbi:hypothetical protein E4K10_47250 [Streptomyces sp. T1317-0309]|nr:hypothetical protein E4K10_47250 [Streptomyces sp. T1317-0309]